MYTEVDKYLASHENIRLQRERNPEDRQSQREEDERTVTTTQSLICASV